MSTSEVFPVFDEYFSDLNQFILGLVKVYEAGEMKSWEHLEERVKAYFTPERMNQMESIVPGWQKMASYSGGITLVHVMGVFLGSFMMAEFQSLNPEQKQLAKWIILFHDLAKFHIKGTRDTKHAFRSAVSAARQLPHFGFAITTEYDHLIASWSELTDSASKFSADFPEPIQDNNKLPEILSGIERMLGEETPSALIVKCVLLHMSVNVVNDWPQAAPLTEEEINRYVTSHLAPLLKVMMLADNEGWVMFYQEREQQRNETLEVFQRIEKIISS